MLEGEALARAVLEAKDRYALLSLGSSVPIKLEKEGYLNLEDEDVRKCYMRIAARIHPDKLTGYREATRAFQALVRAYELCCKPDLRADDSEDSRDDDGGDDDSGDDSDAEGDSDAGDEGGSGEGTGDSSDVSSGAEGSDNASASEDSDEDWSEGGATGGKASPRRIGSTAGKKAIKAPKPKAEPRPGPKAPKAKAKPRRKKNAAKPSKGKGVAIRTGVRCPRCRNAWGDHLRSEGNEAHYTQFMAGRRQVVCTTCLFEFGCLTATHTCPHCSRSFEYRPSQLKRTLRCEAKGCAAKPFKVLIVSQSGARAREEDAILAEADAGRRRRADENEGRAARAERNSAARWGEDGEEWTSMLGGFIVSEDCPVCGGLFTSGHAAHLRKCLAKAGKGGKGGKGGGKGGGAVSKTPAAKRRRSSGSFVVGSYDDDDVDWSYSDSDDDRPPKRPKGGKKPNGAKPKKPRGGAKKLKKVVESSDEFSDDDSRDDRPAKRPKCAKPKPAGDAKKPKRGGAKEKPAKAKKPSAKKASQKPKGAKPKVKKKKAKPRVVASDSDSDWSP